MNAEAFRNLSTFLAAVFLCVMLLSAATTGPFG